MISANYLVSLLTTTITFTSVLIILYIFIRERYYAYKDREGVPSSAYEKLSGATAWGIWIAFGAAFAFFSSLVIIDPIYITADATIPATLAGLGLCLFLLSVIIIFWAFRNLTDEEL